MSNHDGALLLYISIDRDTEPISGTIVVGAAEPRHFAGWLMLTALIERARMDPQPPDPPPPSRAGDDAGHGAGPRRDCAAGGTCRTGANATGNRSRPVVSTVPREEI